jgi:hypothetical protein
VTTGSFGVGGDELTTPLNESSTAEIRRFPPPDNDTPAYTYSSIGSGIEGTFSGQNMWQGGDLFSGIISIEADL